MLRHPLRTTRHKLITVAVVTCALSIGAAVPAFAEGDFTSKVTNGLAGSFQSRWWTDNNLDTWVTRVRFSDCTIAGIPNNEIRGQRVLLRRDNGIFPDHEHGIVTSSCNNTWASWGRMTAKGSYRWQLKEVGVQWGSGTAWTTGYHVNIPSLETRY